MTHLLLEVTSRFSSISEAFASELLVDLEQEIADSIKMFTYTLMCYCRERDVLTFRQKSMMCRKFIIIIVINNNLRA